jgi:hypothetical protein
VPGRAGREQAVAALLRDLGGRLRRGDREAAGTPLERLPTGLPAIDRLLLGGFPAGRLAEISGPASSGRTSVALSLLAQLTLRDHVVAVVDLADALDPTSAEDAGVALDRVLWTRPRAERQALRACEQILDAHGFALVLLDWACGGRSVPQPAAWQKLVRAAAGTNTALVVLSHERITGSFADVAIEMQRVEPQFTGTPALLEGIEIEAVVTRHRTGPDGRAATVRLRSHAA